MNVQVRTGGAPISFSIGLEDTPKTIESRLKSEANVTLSPADAAKFLQTALQSGKDNFEIDIPKLFPEAVITEKPVLVKSTSLGALGVTERPRSESLSQAKPKGADVSVVADETALLEGGVPDAPEMSAPPPPPPPDAPSLVTARVATPTGPHITGDLKKGLKPDALASSNVSASTLSDQCIVFNYAMKMANLQGNGGKVVDDLLKGQLSGITTTQQLATAMQTNPALLTQITTTVWSTVSTEPLPTATTLKLQQATLNAPKDMGAYSGVTSSTNVKVTGWKEVSVTPASLREANEKLEASGSFVKLVAVGEAVEGFVKIKPEWNQSRTVTATHGEAHTGLKALNGSASSFVSYADCHRTAQTIMGSQDMNSGLADTEHVVLGTTLVKPIAKAEIGKVQGATDHGANRGMHAMFQTAMPQFAESLKALISRDGPNPAATAIIKQIEAEVAKAPTPGTYRKIYRDIMDTPALAAKFSKELGLNEHAKPKVGQAFAQINDEFEKANTMGKDFWNFHFAGVVLTDGTSYLTLENLSVEDSNATNEGWYFRLYSEDRNFHSENKKDDHVGKYPTTMLFQAT